MTETVNPPTTITVYGSSSARYPAELATVYLQIRQDGSRREPVFTAVTATAERMRSQLKSLHRAESGPVVSWSSEQVRIWAHRPWNNEGRQLPLVFNATISFQAEFNDFDELSRFVETSAATSDLVALEAVNWSLSKERERTAQQEVQAGAVEDAVAKATAYAAAIGLSTVTAVALADPGLLSARSDATTLGMDFASAPRAFMKTGASHAAELSLQPEDIEVSAAVEAKFHAR